VVDEGLGLAAPADIVIHCADRCEHGARGVDGIASAFEDLRARRGAERFAGNGHPMPPVQHGLVCLRKWFRSRRPARDKESKDGQKDGHDPASQWSGGVLALQFDKFLIGPSMNRPDDRQVLECASPLALWMASWMRKRQRTAALQNADAPTGAPLRFMVSMRVQSWS